jgi:hypothetical protein
MAPPIPLRSGILDFTYDDLEGFAEFEVSELNGKLSGIMSGEFINYVTDELEFVEGEFSVTPPE